MRRIFVETLLKIADQDKRVLLLTADLGFMVLEPFAEKHPERFFNVGVAEQNMMGMATGLAEAGFLPFTYSIVTFATLRPYEFIRNGPILHQLPVRIVGIGGGYEYGCSGPTHHGVEDIAVMRTQPGMTIVIPADDEQTRCALQSTYNFPKPIYYRLSKNNNLTVPGLNGQFTLGRANIVCEGKDVLWITMGNISAEVVQATKLLSKQGISSTVVIVSSMNPSPTDDIANILSHFPFVITVETHYIDGGLGSLVAEVIAENNINCKLVRKGVTTLASGKTGSQKYYDAYFGLNAYSLAKRAVEQLEVLHK